jgi:DNA-binding IclR family transcriptional regulator
MKTLDKSLLILAALAEAPDASLTELARRAGIDKVIVHRILKTFAAHRYVAQDPRTRRYRIGSAPLKIAERFAKANPPHVLIAPCLAALRDLTSETVHFTILQEVRVLLMSVFESVHRVRVAGEVGDSAPIHCTASGKAFLAFGDATSLDLAFSQKPDALTPRTIVGRAEMKRELARIRDCGYATDDEEFSIGACAVAAPILGFNGHLVGCVTVVAPSSRLGRADLAKLARPVMRTAAECSTELQPGSQPARPANADGERPAS